MRWRIGSEARAKERGRRLSHFPAEERITPITFYKATCCIEDPAHGSLSDRLHLMNFRAGVSIICGVAHLTETKAIHYTTINANTILFTRSQKVSKYRDCCYDVVG